MGHLEKGTKLINEYGKSYKNYAIDCSGNKFLYFRKTELKSFEKKGIPKAN
jgi:hypothetical protein